ncbi:Deoxyribodipyrimidine photo-lyase [Pseudobythopirellula maris]|uniref:Deoxyribodipyrimidine photo-lyase n=1 Tax=Pseudobythopirellula maris TaxID=2527991 RepID=A0A5C5ZTP1_9BACT|nr:deoxyribodipyrimidine photolyase [Pseudobythopirellula maris]TWT90924.1 Deoxyribodipyrimidine photo-lyase [Pseudobythopirellula maris]
MSQVPAIRLRTVKEAPVRRDGDWVLYWMTAQRRPRYNFALQHALHWCEELGKPLVVLEPLRCDYPWSCERFHRFVVQGMADNARAMDRKGVTHYPYLEPEPGAGRGLLAAWAERACVVVGDDYPAYFLRHLPRAAARQIDVRLEVVDSNGLLPMRAADRTFARAYDLRRFLQKNLLEHLAEAPESDPLDETEPPRSKPVPDEIAERWPAAEPRRLLDEKDGFARFPFENEVPTVETLGGHVAGEETLLAFVEEKLEAYGDQRNQPERDATSRLSPYLHFGCVSAHQAFDEIADREQWSPKKVSSKTAGQREGWWGMSPAAESFLDELVTWRELGFNMCSRETRHDRYESLPDWAQKTLAEHEDDEREHVYTLEEFERGATHDDLWNAAQGQLVREGYIHNYLRMLWGKKILHWSESPRAALDIMLELNNKYALDGRDPNSYSGIFWVLGRYDRAWGPEREIFGKIRYMTCDNTRRKCSVDGYIDEYAPSDGQLKLGFD